MSDGLTHSRGSFEPIPAVARVAVEDLSPSPLSASLPWYDFPELRWATDAFWAGVASHLRDLGLENVPEELGHEDDYEEVWRRPGLLLSQCCGYDAVLPPYRGFLRVVATPCYRAPGCHGPNYSSVVVVRDASRHGRLEDLRGARCVINNPTSHSGVNALRAMVAPLSRDGRFFATVEETGSHVTSLELVQAGAADVAAVDVVVIELVRRLRPELLNGIRTLAVTAPAAAPPYVSSCALPAETHLRVRLALNRAMVDPWLARARQALLLDRVEFLSRDVYLPMVSLVKRSRSYGYREMDAAQPSRRRPPCLGRGMAADEVTACAG